MTKSICLEYKLPSHGFDEYVFVDDLEGIANLAKNLEAALRDLYKNKTIDTFMHLDTNAFVIDIRGKNQGDIAQAVDRLFEQAGVPNFVYRNYLLAEEKLAPYGKTLQRRFGGALVGKHVVDK